MDFICPYKCSYRTSSGYCGSTGGWESCQYRQLHQPNTVVGYVPPLKKTNADRIRAMTDEELAVFLTRAAPLLINQFAAIKCAMTTEDMATRTWFDWLKQEANE